MMQKLIGVHLAGLWADKLEILKQWQPPLCLVLQPKVESIKKLREVCPQAIIIGRFFHDDSHYASNINARTKEFAKEIHQEIVNNPVTPLLDYVQSNNETNQDWFGIQKLNEFTFDWMFLADQSQVYKCAILTFSVGNPDLPYKPGDPAGFDGKMLYWQQVLPSLSYAQKNNHLLLLHAYGYPTMFSSDADWYIYRYERQVQENLSAIGITNLKYAYGEIGIDRLIVDGKGGYKVNTTDQGYVNQLLQWEKDLQNQKNLLGGAIFTFGDSGGWDSYDIASTSVANMLADHYASHSGDYDMPNTEENHTVFIPIVGKGETTVPEPTPLPARNLDPRAYERGVRVETPPLSPGQPYWFAYEIKWYNEQEADQLGPDHHIMIDAQIDGKRAAGTQALVTWPTGEDDIPIEEKSGEPYGGNFPMTPGKFSVRMLGELPSEKVTGIEMGAMTPSGWNAGIHTTTGVRFRKEIMQEIQSTPTPVTVDTGPEIPNEPKAVVPILVHPIQNPAQRVISQRFGENPQDYAKFGLAGHNGVDYAVIVGTPIVAVDDGDVIESRVDADGYGEYVKLRHTWGESLYAHLSFRNFLSGRIGKGGLLGHSGNTGNSTGPHLHLGIRVNPYTRGAPFDGFSDPLLYLDTTAMEEPKPTTYLEIVKVIALAALEFDVDSDLLLSQAWAESSFNPKAVSSAGAKGLLQIMDTTWAEWSAKIGAGNDPFDAQQNARVGAAYLAWLITTVNGNVYKALVAYGWGIGNLLSGDEIPNIWKEYANKIVHGRNLLRAVG